MATQTDSPDRTTRRSAPRPRRPATTPRGYAKAHAEFQARAQEWLRTRADNLVRLPEDLLAIARLGIPRRTCGNLIYRAGAGSDHHSIDWSRLPGEHWAAGITASCA